MATASWRCWVASNFVKIAIVVHGRLHAFDLALALLQRGHDVTVLTNYPKWAVAKFHIPASSVRSFPLEGVLSRVAYTAHSRWGAPLPEGSIHRLFGTWAARQLARSCWEWIYCFTGVSEELLAAFQSSAMPCMLVRGSAHIRVQARLLEEEARRTSIRLDGPTPWMIRREESEYRLATRIVTQSEFSYRTFLEEGFTGERLLKIPMGVNISQFRAAGDAVEERCRRIRSHQPLRILYVGALSLRKGLWDLLSIAKALPSDRFVLRCIGPVAPDGLGLVPELKKYAEIVSKQPHQDLPKWYAKSDLFVFPTIEDGFAAVLPQAQANALPILTTTNCAGPDLITQGRTGWILPIRSPERFVERLLWCDGHREELEEMVRCLYFAFTPRSFDDAARELEESITGVLH
jgi:glycosyltransferase involved in cell wall biosynthesis